MGKQWKQWQILFPWAPKSLCHEIKRHLLLGRKVMTNLDSVLKSRDITLPAKVCLVKAMVFPVVMYGCESWTIKKTECQKIDAFKLLFWRRLLRVPWTAKSSQAILKEINHEFSLEGPMLMLKLQYLGHLTQRADSLEKTQTERSGAGREGGNRRWDGLMALPTQWACVWANSGRYEEQRSQCAAVHGVVRVRYDSETDLNWTEH